MRKASIILFLLIVTSVYTQVCVDTVTEHNCDFYTKCLENKFQCGATGYPIGYGFKYCSKFLEFQSEFPQKGREWIDGTLLCLKQALVQFTTKSTDPKICNNILQTAFDSHPNCYVQAGFCELFYQPDIVQTVQALLKVYELNDFKSLTSIKQIFQTAKMCGGEVLAKLWDIINGKKLKFSTSKSIIQSLINKK